MKRWGSIFLCLVFLWSCRNSADENPLDRKLAKAYAIEDFKAFSTILKSSHPSLNIYISQKKLNLLIDSIENTIKDDINIGALFSKYNYVINEIGCAHTYMKITDVDYDSLLNRRFFFPIPVKLIDGRLLVNAKNRIVPEGTEIIAINEKPVSKILSDIAIYENIEGLSRPTLQKLAAEYFALNYFYAYGQSSNFHLQIIDTSGKQQSINNNASITLAEWYEVRNNSIYYFDQTNCDYDLSINREEKYAYMRIRTFSFASDEEQNAFENFCQNSFELMQFKKNITSLIIDLRENQGGDLYNSSLLFSYLAREKFREYESASSKINSIKNPEYLDKEFLNTHRSTIDQKLSDEYYYSSKNRSYMQSDSMISNWQPNEFAFKGNVYIITNAKVASAASYFSVMVKNSGVGKVIGEETTGGNFSGNAFKSMHYTLPFSKLGVVFPYGHIIYTYKEKVNKGRGLVPNFEVPDSYESFRNNKDRQMMFVRDSLLTKN